MPDLLTPPAPRLTYEADGSLVVHGSGTAMPASGAAVLPTNVDKLVDENPDSGYDAYAPLVSNATTSYSVMAVVFPRLRNILGYALRRYVWSSTDGGSVKSLDVNTLTVQTSVDTTDGFDGTWVAQGNAADVGTTEFNHRLSISGVSWTGIKGVRFIQAISHNYSTSTSRNHHEWHLLHLYGTEAAPVTERLEFWDDGLDQALSAADLDLGKIAGGDSAVLAFRLHNPTAAAATGLQLTAQQPETGDPMAAALEFSTNGVSYAPSLSVPDIAAGGTSGVLYVRRSVAVGEPVDVNRARLAAIPSDAAIAGYASLLENTALSLFPSRDAYLGLLENVQLALFPSRDAYLGLLENVVPTQRPTEQYLWNPATQSWDPLLDYVWDTGTSAWVPLG